MKNVSTRGLTGLLGDIRKNNNFIVHIEDITQDGNSLDLVIQKAFLPQVSLNVLELRHGNDAIKLAGVATWQGGQITILDTLSRVELDTLLEWFNQTYDTETGTIGLASEYKKVGYITEYASDGRYQRRWTVNGMWISDTNLGELDAESGDQKRVQFSIQIDPSPLKPKYYDSKDAEWSD
jgi:hypothetical protein